MKVAALNIYPLKSGRGIAMPSVEVRGDGFAGDRRFMVVRPDGKVITQRELQQLAQMDAKITDIGDLQLKMQAQTVTFSFASSKRMQVDIWGATVNAAVAPDSVNATVSEWLHKPIKLVHMDEAASRMASADWVATNSQITFADEFQVLITTTGSLRDLNQTMQALGQDAVGMDRFRTNIVIDHDEPWAEDSWQSIQTGDVIFDLVKPCARCIMTTQDQVNGTRTGGDPIKGLAVNRMSADRRVPGPLFGWNAVPRAAGRIALGEAVTVLAQRADRWPMKGR